MSESIKNFCGKGIAVRGNDIDTDRIIPARYMKCVTFSGLGAYAFYDERFDGAGKSKGHSFDDMRWAGHPVLLSNANFGCGSSREHAPQALKDYGIRAIVAESFAEIFAGNCSSLGIPAVTLSAADMKDLQTCVENSPQTEISIDMENMTIQTVGKTWKAAMPETYRQALLDGSWDSTAVLASSMPEIEKTAGSLPYMVL
ncbi:MAG: 3-isopropylmalate dehydratase small subunit [Spirochaeta sp. LUC14_002_19_P3]|nr:MAG: 3-isopropylmalate dehydratase small subunit [Spirochaeta sp. LUC14_002_19_P3]